MWAITVPICQPLLPAPAVLHKCLPYSSLTKEKYYRNHLQGVRKVTLKKKATCKTSPFSLTVLLPIITSLAPLVFQNTKPSSLATTSLTVQLPSYVQNDLDCCSGEVVGQYICMYYSFVIHPKWMQVISREPKAIFNFIPGGALKLQGCCRRFLPLFCND